MATLRLGPHYVETPWVDAEELQAELEKARRDLIFEATDLVDFMEKSPRTENFDF